MRRAMEDDSTSVRIQERRPILPHESNVHNAPPQRTREWCRQMPEQSTRHGCAPTPNLRIRPQQGKLSMPLTQWAWGVQQSSRPSAAGALHHRRMPPRCGAECSKRRRHWAGARFSRGPLQRQSQRVHRTCRRHSWLPHRLQRCACSRRLHSPRCTWLQQLASVLLHREPLTCPSNAAEGAVSWSERARAAGHALEHAVCCTASCALHCCPCLHCSSSLTLLHASASFRGSGEATWQRIRVLRRVTPLQARRALVASLRPVGVPAQQPGSGSGAGASGHVHPATAHYSQAQVPMHDGEFKEVKVGDVVWLQQTDAPVQPAPDAGPAYAAARVTEIYKDTQVRWQCPYGRTYTHTVHMGF